MTLTIDLRPELLEELETRAAKLGKQPADYVRQLLERDLASATFDEILAPIRAEIAASGMSDEELDAFFNENIREVRQERKAVRR